jgi:hypothetical protein
MDVDRDSTYHLHQYEAPASQQYEAHEGRAVVLNLDFEP